MTLTLTPTVGRYAVPFGYSLFLSFAGVQFQAPFQARAADVEVLLEEAGGQAPEPGGDRDPCREEREGRGQGARRAGREAVDGLDELLVEGEAARGRAGDAGVAQQSQTQRAG